jgi:hypothetical protein
LRHKSPYAAKQIHKTSLVQDLGNNRRGNLTACHILHRLRNVEFRIHQGPLERQDDPATLHVNLPHARLDRPADLEALLGVLELNVGIVIRPDYAVHRSVDVDKQALFRKTVDGTADVLSDLELVDSHKDLIQDLLLEREQQDAVERRVPNDACAVERAGLVRTK